MIIVLQEFEKTQLAASVLSHQWARHLQTHYAAQVDVRWLFEREQWEMTAQGWVGSIPLGDHELQLRPKIPLHNLFHLLDVADNLILHELPDVVQSDSVADFYSRLAQRLARAVLQRVQRGLFQSYEPRQARLPYVRGRVLAHQIGPARLDLPVQYAELSADNQHNQLLLAALHSILRTRLLTESAGSVVRQAYRKLRGSITLDLNLPLRDLAYTRLNADYRPMHVLCRFFLTRTMPFHALGSAETLPFLVNMATLFERFVAQWLMRHLPAAYRLRVQERSGVADGKIQIAIDLVIVERATGRVLMVLDTKWKSAEKPANDDIYQVAFYANTRHSPQAILIYPAPLTHPLDETIRDVRLRTLTFDVSQPVDSAGNAFLEKLLDTDTTNDTMTK